MSNQQLGVVVKSLDLHAVNASMNAINQNDKEVFVTFTWYT